jgi:hypothetical protein
MTSGSAQENYDRGVLAGEVATRLAGHDKHFASINGSLDKIAHTLDQFLVKQNAMIVEIQRLNDNVDLLKEAEKSSHATKVSITSSPWLTILVVIAFIGIIIGMIAGVVAVINN